MIGYNTPSALFWDENYHIASAQKYLDGVMFMEPHPPLGKMLLAFGEWILDPNSGKDKSEFLETDYIQDHHLPDDMSFAGFRLMSALLMALAAPFFYFTLVNVLGNRHLAVMFSSLLLFDNALVVHSRAAMLDSIQIFFSLLAIWYWVRTIKKGRPVETSRYATLAFLVALVVCVKVNGAILLLLLVMLYGYDCWPDIKRRAWRAPLKRLAISAPLAAGILSVTFLGLMYVHIAMGQRIVDNRTYDASPEYIEAIGSDNTTSLSTFALGLRDNLKYMANYADGVPRLDVCKEGENGSSAIGWPLGTKTINYRWSKNTVDGETRVRYLYLVGNPVVWLSVLVGMVLSVSLMLARFVYRVQPKNVGLFYWSAAFTALYISYMAAVLQIERVMYLYHYFMPLVFGMINVSIVFSYVYREEIVQRSRHMYVNVAVFCMLVLIGFWHFAPFSYYFPLTETEFSLREWFQFWRLESVR